MTIKWTQFDQIGRNFNFPYLVYEMKLSEINWKELITRFRELNPGLYEESHIVTEAS